MMLGNTVLHDKNIWNILASVSLPDQNSSPPNSMEIPTTRASSRQLTHSEPLLNVFHPWPFLLRASSLWVCLPVTSSSQKILQKTSAAQSLTWYSLHANCCPQQQTGRFVEKHHFAYHINSAWWRWCLCPQPVHSAWASVWTKASCLCSLVTAAVRTLISGSVWLNKPSDFQSQPRCSRKCYDY